MGKYLKTRYPGTPCGREEAPKRENWSGRPELNRRPLGPEPSALPGCATPRLPSNLSYTKEFFKGSNLIIFLK